VHLENQAKICYYFSMDKLRYYAWDFDSPFREQPKSRIIVREDKRDSSDTKATIFMHNCPSSDKEFRDTVREDHGFGLASSSLGALELDFPTYSRKATFSIEMKPEHRSKGYGSILMNGGAKYCRDNNLSEMSGEFALGGDWQRRKEFYARLGIQVFPSNVVKAYSDLPFLNIINFVPNETVEEMLNTMRQLQ